MIGESSKVVDNATEIDQMRYKLQTLEPKSNKLNSKMTVVENRVMGVIGNMITNFEDEVHAQNKGPTREEMIQEGNRIINKKLTKTGKRIQNA